MKDRLFSKGSLFAVLLTVSLTMAAPMQAAFRNWSHPEVFGGSPTHGQSSTAQTAKQDNNNKPDNDKTNPPGARHHSASQHKVAKPKSLALQSHPLQENSLPHQTIK